MSCESFTVTWSFCFLPLALSWMLASPSATGVTRPDLVTAATLELDDLNWVLPVTSRSVPSGSFAGDDDALRGPLPGEDEVSRAPPESR